VNNRAASYVISKPRSGSPLRGGRPPLPGRFLEIKSRTWSRRDAESKAGMILEILNLLDAGTAEAFRQDYVEMAERSRQKK
jgi:hypothetical protein